MTSVWMDKLMDKAPMMLLLLAVLQAAWVVYTTLRTGRKATGSRAASTGKSASAQKFLAAPLRTHYKQPLMRRNAVEDGSEGVSVDVEGGDGGAAVDSTPFSAPKPINGWVPDENAECFGLPGAVAPTGYFDPAGFCQKGIPLNDVKRYREAEVQHGRVAMLASVGYLAGESVASGGPFGLTGPANDQLAQVPGPAFAALSIGVGVAETLRATTGWVEPNKPNSLWTLRDEYYPGDIGFDPLGLKPSNPKDFANMQTKELQNGRLAMIGTAGMCAQELCNHKTIAETYEFYQKLNAGLDPYDTAVTVGGAAVMPLQ